MLEHAFNLYEKVLDGCLCEVVDTDKMQYEFMPGRGIVDAKNTKLFFIFLDLEKAFDRVPREVNHFALR